jgi:hypothetical protein
MNKKRSLLQGGWELEHPIVIPTSQCVLGPFLQRSPAGFVCMTRPSANDLALLDTQKQRAVMIVR